ncbi:MAG TPA: sigma-70 family RNA polymerase sigma factor [Planctomycetaceae bacterium]|nr:sigma-70 family RNA polymerase sigma factor [Planctomycetaceae bacterium]
MLVERARRLTEQSVECVYHKSFADRKAESEILAPAPADVGANRLMKAPPGLPPYLTSLYQFPLLTREQEAYYFRKMNYLKFRAAGARERLNVSRPSIRQMDQIEGDLRQAGEIKNLLIRRNLRLVVSIARKFVRDNMNFFEMVSDGNLSLMRAIEKFDYSRGFKFSTYATWAIQRNFARSIPAEHTRQTRFRTGGDEFFQHYHYTTGTSQFEQERTNLRQREALTTILDRLDPRERDIITTRFGLKRGTEPQTLEQVGSQFGVTKERIRQLEARALRKLREFAEEEKLDIPGM